MTFEEVLTANDAVAIEATGGNFWCLHIRRPDPAGGRHRSGSVKDQYIRINGSNNDWEQKKQFAIPIMERGQWDLQEDYDLCAPTMEWSLNGNRSEHYYNSVPKSLPECNYLAMRKAYTEFMRLRLAGEDFAAAETEYNRIADGYYYEERRGRK